MRKAKAKKRILLPDPKFNDTLVTRFVNNLMLDGKKSTAFRIFYDAIDVLGASNVKSSKTKIALSFAFIEKADLRAKAFNFLFNLKE